MAASRKRHRPAWRRKLGYLLQAGVAWLWLTGTGALPAERAARLGAWIATRVGPRLGMHRRARANLLRAMPELSDVERNTILHGMWANLGQVLGEYAHLSSFRLGPGSPGVEVVGMEFLADAVQGPHGAVVVSGHLANWEILGFAAVLVGHPLSLVYRPPNNPYVDRALNRIRQRGAHRLIPKGAKGARQLLADLAEHRSIALLIDQKMNDGIAVPFFGIEAMTSQAVPQMVQRSGCTVVMVRPERLGPARFRVTVMPPLELPRDERGRIDRLASMTLINGQLEAWIRERPAEWLWVHRRWPSEEPGGAQHGHLPH